jgi:protocatechuate 3,4-dioxygenase beta subunit
MRFDIGRRELIVGGAGVLLAGSARAQPPVVTPPQIEGPFYPYQLPAETDCDLVRLSTDDAPALGAGRARVRHRQGLWRAALRQCAGRAVAGGQPGEIPSSGGDDSHKRDVRFQGYGRTMTDAAGAFRFRTIRPPAYLYDEAKGLRRAPHKHLAVSTRGVRRLTTQLYVEGEPLNASDHWLNMVADPLQRASLVRPYLDGSAVERGTKRVQYDIVIIA